MSEERENGWRDDVNATESEAMQARGDKVGWTALAGGSVNPASETLLIKEEVSGGVAWLDEEGYVVARARVGVNHVVEVEVGEDVGIVDEDRLVANEWKGSEESAAGVEEKLRLVADGDVDVRIVIVEKINDLRGEMVDIDDDVGDAGIEELVDDASDDRLTSHGSERLGVGVGPRLEATANAGGKNHTFHSS